jgi:hypothetical protein
MRKNSNEASQIWKQTSATYATGQTQEENYLTK